MDEEPQGRAVVLVVGDNTIDEIDGVGRVGGNAVNVAVQLIRHGYLARYAGVVGRDENGRIIARALRGQGLEIDLLDEVDGESAVTVIGHTPEGDRVFVREDFGVTADYVPGDAVLAAARSCGWLHIGMLPGSSRFVTEVRREIPGILISQDCAVSSGMAGLDVAFCSVGEHQDPRLAAQRARRAGAGLVVVTRGAAGAIAHDGDRWWEQRALPVKVVDTTGAGDSFIAGFISERACGGSVEESLERGAEWASFTCSHVGGWPQ